MKPAWFLLAALLSLPATAGDCDECLKAAQPKNCEERIARAKAHGCEMPVTIKIVDHEVPCSTKPCTPTPCIPVDCTPQVVEKVSIVETTPKQHFRFAFGGDLGWNEEHKALYGLHAGFLAPVDRHGGNLFWKIGPTYQDHVDFDATCTIGCRTCAAHGDPAGPWGALTSLSYIWK